MPNEIIRPERHDLVLGLQARIYGVVQNTNTGRILNQKIDIYSRQITGYGGGAVLSVELRFDDGCRNGHETFYITGEVRGPRGVHITSGCIHEDIARVFPELEPLIKWHHTSTDGPMYYIANTCYHASDRDCHGPRKGERKPILGPDKMPTWVPKTKPEQYVKSYEQPAPVLVEHELWCREGEGKARDLDAARRVAVWPNATDEELCQERSQLEAVLKARLPGLLAAFKQDMLNVGFIYPTPSSSGEHHESQNE